MTLIRRVSFFLIFLQFFSIFTSTYATTLVIPSSGDVVGEVQYALSESNETIEEVGIRFDIGYSEMISANPQVNARYPLAANSPLIIPSQFILPNVSRKGIVINLAEYRLYYFPENENVVLTFPVGIGRKGWKTPLGILKLLLKKLTPCGDLPKIYAPMPQNTVILFLMYFPQALIIL